MRTFLVAAVVILGAGPGFGQGQLIFQNSSATAITNALTGQAVPGSSAQDDTQVGLYVGNVGAPVNSMTLVGPTTNLWTAGRFAGGTRTLPGWTGTVQLQVRCWLASTVYPSYEAALAAAMGGDSSVILGASAPFSFTLTLSPNLPVSIAVNGLTPIVLAPGDSFGPPVLSSPSVSMQGTSPANGTRTVRLSVWLNPGSLGTSTRFQYGTAVPYAATNPPVSLPPLSEPTNLTVTLPFGPGFTYHWNAISTNSLGTATLADQSFSIAPTASGITGDVNGDGLVSQAELEAVYAHYVTNSPWLALTNVAGLGGTNVTFALSNGALGAYSVEYSTNLTNWFPLGPASPRYGFTDTNATALPVRHYRLRYP